MNNYYPITEVKARQILDSRGNPTIEAEVKAADYIIGRASVPSGASTGRFEAVELRDGTTEYFGLAVQNAVRHVNERIAKEITGMNVLEQENIDAKMIALDGTENKSNLGANAMLAVSMAGKGGGKCLRDSALPLSGRMPYQTLSGSDDEYFKRWKTRGEYRGFSGIYDYAGKCREFCGRASQMRGGVS